MDERDVLLTQAASLDDQARGVRQADGRQLRREAADLRIRALGQKPYPVLVCSTCFKLTGWLGLNERCDTCIDSDHRKAAYADPSGGWVDLSEGDRQHGSVEEAPGGWKRAVALVGWRGPLRELRVATWMRHVEPGETGPIDPEEGFETAVADRTDDAAPEGPDLLVRFFVRAASFDGNQWRPVVGVGLPDPLTPSVFPASLPIEQLAEAWNDFRTEVEEFNRARWSEEDARREQERDAEDALLRARREQQGTSGLLD
jgi:hypothetical protein